MTTLYLVRHGESEANVQRVFSNGKVDLPLTVLGVRQAEQAAVWLAERGIAHVFSAPLLRARQTATIIAGRLGSPMTVLPDLDEVRVGDLDGRRDDDAWAELDRVLACWRTGDRAAAFPGGETFGRAFDRFSAALRQIAHSHPDQATVAVSHGAIQLTVLPRLCAELVVDPWELRNASITTLEVTADGVTCTLWGATDHIRL